MAKKRKDGTQYILLDAGLEEYFIGSKCEIAEHLAALIEEDDMDADDVRHRFSVYPLDTSKKVEIHVQLSPTVCLD